MSTSLTRLLSLLGVAMIALVSLGALATPATAHPLGNFTTNTSTAILPTPERVDLVIIVDLAEVPTQQARDDIAAAGDLQAWAADECSLAVDGHRLTVDGTPAALEATGVGAAFLPGDAGLETLRVRCDATAAHDDDLQAEQPRTLEFTDGYRTDRVGWREVLAAGDGVEVTTSDVPTTSTSAQLREYPEGEVSDVRSATLSFAAGQGDGDAVATLRATDLEIAEPPAPAGGFEGLVERYTDLVSRQDLTPGFVLLAVVLSIVLGTAHAVAPGHGKTVIAAYLLGEGGQARQAIGLGATVAVTHTIGVLVLGVVVQTSIVLAPDQLYPILGAIGGALFTLVGITLLRRALSGEGHDHSHAHDHDHDHDAGVHEHSHDGGHAHSHDLPRSGSGWRMLILPGLAGGMVPSPSALVVLLGGIALGRTWFGILLVLFYGVGMALALVGAGYLLHRVRDRAQTSLEGETWARISGALPVATSSLIILGGLVIIGRSLLLA